MSRRRSPAPEPPALSASGFMATFPDATAWPATGAALSALEHRLRYAHGAERDAIMAATVVAAYRALVAAPRRKRERVVRGLRAPRAPRSVDGPARGAP